MTLSTILFLIVAFACSLRPINADNIVSVLEQQPRGSVDLLVNVLTSPKYSKLFDQLSDGNATYTFFAPSDQALNSAASILSPSLDITNVLLYHVVNETIYTTENLTAGSNIFDTLDNSSNIETTLAVNVYWNKTNSSVQVFSGWNYAVVRQADIKAGKSVIHIIDRVLEEPNNVTFTLAANPSNDPKLSTQTIFKDFIKYNLTDTVNSAEGITLFAPSDDAFASVDLSKYNATQMIAILEYHIVKMPLSTVNISNITRNGQHVNVLTLEGSTVALSSSGSDIFIDGADSSAKVTYGDVITNNGFIHVIDTVLIPTTASINNFTANFTHKSLASAHFRSFTTFPIIAAALVVISVIMLY